MLARATLLLIGLAFGAPTAIASTLTLEYEIAHPVLGRIGTYVNEIETAGGRTTIQSTLRVVASLLGVVMHREYADRIEVWEGGRLFYFDGVTTVNGTSLHIHGEAYDRHFIVDRPDGTEIAPADVYTNNPWSCAFVQGSTVFNVKTGIVEPARVTGGATEMIRFDRDNLATRHYQVDSRWSHGNVWLNQSCVPVKMDVLISGDKITLILRRQIGRPDALVRN